MGRRVPEDELRRRAIAGVRDEVEAFGCAAPGSSLIRSEGLLASRGHELDGSPRAMALDLADLAPEPPQPEGVEPGAGARTAALRASKTGAGVYERLGFSDLGFVEMWELRS